MSRPLVSFVLSGGKYAQRVHPKTAERIRRIAKQLNYHPNHAAQQLTGKRSSVLGALASNWFYFPLRPRFLAYLNQAGRRPRAKDPHLADQPAVRTGRAIHA